MMVTRVISDNGLKATNGGFDIDIRLPWYRSLPLSTVDVVDVGIDGQKIDPKNVRFELEGAQFRLDEMRRLTTKWWYVLDSALLHVKGVPIQRGKDYSVEVTVAVSPPYIPAVRQVHGVKTLRAA